MMAGAMRWVPAVLFGLGAFLVLGLGPQKSLELREPLQDAVPRTLAGFEQSADVEVTRAEARVAGFTDYLMRNYEDADRAPLSVYVAYYASQTQGRTIHSPKNCLPGSGWEPLASQVADIRDEDGRRHRVNRYILQREDERALVLYWYQGRGRVANDEYRVKWNLLRDAALRQRSDEALVRIVVPITSTEEAAFESASRAAGRLIPAVARALPE